MDDSIDSVSGAGDQYPAASCDPYGFHLCRNQYALVGVKLFPVLPPVNGTCFQGCHKLHPAGRQGIGSFQIDRAKLEMRVVHKQRPRSPSAACLLFLCFSDFMIASPFFTTY